MRNELSTKVNNTSRLQTAAGFQGLANVPFEVEWFESNKCFPINSCASFHCGSGNFGCFAMISVNGATWITAGHSEF
jgi:hypothetical protein